MALNVIITNAGRAELINAENTGTAPVKITQIGFTAATFTPTTALTALPSEAKRVSSIAGEVVAPDTISVTAKDEGTTAYTVRGFGVYTASGTLFAVYGQAAPVIEKAAAATLLLTIDIILADINAASLTFGDITFSNPPASLTKPGVVTLNNATNSTAQNQAATPRAVKAANDNAGTRLAKSQNLADLANAETARKNLGLGEAATLETTALRTSASTSVLLQAAAMNSHRTSADHDDRYARRSNNLSDLASADTARENLGLKEAAVRDVGESSGNVMQVGAFGLGGGGASMPLNDCNKVSVSGFYSLSNASVNAFPGQIGGDALLSCMWSSTYGMQIGGSRSSRFWVRYCTNGIWSKWEELQHSGNQLSLGTTAATARSALELGASATMGTTASRTSTSTSTVLQAAGMNAHRQSGDHDARYPQRSNNLSDLANATTARENLGLKAAAVRDVGESSGNVMQVGAFGLGGTGKNINSMAEFNNLRETLFYSVNSNAYTPFEGFGVGLSVVRSASSAVQVHFPLGAGAIQYRELTSNGWQPIKKVWDSFNQLEIGTTAATARSALELGASATMGTTASRTSTSTSTLLQAAGMNAHRQSGDHDDRYPQRSNNLSDLSSSADARSNLGLKGAATRAVGESSGNLMEVGAFGLGVFSNTFESWPPPAVTGLSGNTSSNTENSPVPFSWAQILQLRRSQSRAAYLALNSLTDVPELAVGVQKLDGSDVFVSVYTTANLSPVETTRTINAGTGLIGGGNLSANRTIALSADTVASLAAADSAVQPSRSIAAGTGLTGGGSLSTNRTIALAPSTISSLAAADSAVQPSRSIAAGTGLTGGGSLSTNRTIALAPSTISSLAAADSAVQPSRKINAGAGLIGGGSLAGDRTISLGGMAPSVSNIAEMNDMRDSKFFSVNSGANTPFAGFGAGIGVFRNSGSGFQIQANLNGGLTNELAWRHLTSAGWSGIKRLFDSDNIESAFPRVLSPSGRQILPGGMIMQWGNIDFGSVTSGSEARRNVTFPLTFPNGVWQVFGTLRSGLFLGGLSGYSCENLVPTGFTAVYYYPPDGGYIDPNINWFAIGN